MKNAKFVGSGFLILVLAGIFATSFSFLKTTKANATTQSTAYSSCSSVSCQSSSNVSSTPGQKSNQQQKFDYILVLQPIDANLIQFSGHPKNPYLEKISVQVVFYDISNSKETPGRYLGTTYTNSTDGSFKTSFNRSQFTSDNIQIHPYIKNNGEYISIFDQPGDYHNFISSSYNQIHNTNVKALQEQYKQSSDYFNKSVRDYQAEIAKHAQNIGQRKLEYESGNRNYIDLNKDSRLGKVVQDIANCYHTRAGSDYQLQNLRDKNIIYSKNGNWYFDGTKAAQEINKCNN